MEIIEVVLYFILTIILIALIGVLTWLVYDYFKYKKEISEKTTNIIKTGQVKPKNIFNAATR